MVPVNDAEVKLTNLALPTFLFAYVATRDVSATLDAFPASPAGTFTSVSCDESVMVIADEIDDNLYLASRNLANVLVVEPRYADPVSLVHYKKVLVTKGAIDKLKEMFA